MLKNESQYNYVKDILVSRMSGYRRNSFKLRRLYSIIAEKANDEAYIDFSYEEFYEMFVKECINGNIPDHKFAIAEQGYLDYSKKQPYHNISVDFTYVPKRKRRAKTTEVVAATGTTKTC